MQSKSIILTVLLVCMVFCFALIESSAQGVPPRSQTLQMIRPTTPPPVPPLQREVTEVKKEVSPTTEAQKNIRSWQSLCAERENYLKNIYLYEPGLKDRPQFVQEARKAHIRKEIENCKRTLAGLKARGK